MKRKNTKKKYTRKGKLYKKRKSSKKSKINKIGRRNKITKKKGGNGNQQYIRIIQNKEKPVGKDKMVWKEVALNFDNTSRPEYRRYYIEKQNNNGDGIIENPLLLVKLVHPNYIVDDKEMQIQKELSQIGLAPKINKKPKQISRKTSPTNNFNKPYFPKSNKYSETKLLVYFVEKKTTFKELINEETDFKHLLESIVSLVEGLLKAGYIQCDMKESNLVLEEEEQQPQEKQEQPQEEQEEQQPQQQEKQQEEQEEQPQKEEKKLIKYKVLIIDTDDPAYFQEYTKGGNETIEEKYKNYNTFIALFMLIFYFFQYKNDKGVITKLYGKLSIYEENSNNDERIRNIVKEFMKKFIDTRKINKEDLIAHLKKAEDIIVTIRSMIHRYCFFYKNIYFNFNDPEVLVNHMWTMLEKHGIIIQ